MAFETVETGGSAVLYIVFSIFLASTAGMAFLSYRRPHSSPLDERLNCYVTYAIMAIATLSYFAMATGGGSTLVLVEGTTYRELYYARYVDWVFTTPLLLLDLVLLGTPTFEHTARLIFYDVLMIITGLFGALASGWSRWGWYSFGCFFMFLIFWDLAISVRRQVYSRSRGMGGLYDILASLLIVLWLLYPVVWAFGEGMNLFSVNVEVICYGILDIIAKVVFGWALVLRRTGKIELPETPLLD